MSRRIISAIVSRLNLCVLNTAQHSLLMFGRTLSHSALWNRICTFSLVSSPRDARCPQGGAALALYHSRDAAAAMNSLVQHSLLMHSGTGAFSLLSSPRDVRLPSPFIAVMPPPQLRTVSALALYHNRDAAAAASSLVRSASSRSGWWFAKTTGIALMKTCIRRCHGAGGMEKVAWSRCHAACCMERVAWSMLHGAGVMEQVAWSRCHGAGGMEQMPNHHPSRQHHNVSIGFLGLRRQGTVEGRGKRQGRQPVRVWGMLGVCVCRCVRVRVRWCALCLGGRITFSMFMP